MTRLDYTLVPEEFDDLILVLMEGAKKYEPKGWEKGIKFEREDNIASIKRHLADFRRGNLKDEESGLHPLLHVATRALMQYTMDKRAQEPKSSVVEMKKATVTDMIVEAHQHGWLTLAQVAELGRRRKERDQYTPLDEHRPWGE